MLVEIKSYTIFESSNNKDMLPESIINRSIKFVQQGHDAIEAVKMAIEEEQQLIFNLIENSAWTSTLGRKVADVLCESVYNKLSTPKK